MQIDQAGANHLAGNVHHLGVRGGLGGQIWAHGGDLAIRDEYVGNGINAIRWVYDSSTGKQQ